MKRFLIAVILLLTVSCDDLNLKDLRFEYGTQLAQRQDRLMKSYRSGDSIPDTELEDLKKNAWFLAAVETTPSNLVIRQWCLIDLLSGSADNAESIRKQMDILSIPEDGRLWIEGYSYWLYTRDFVLEWANKFGQPEIKQICFDIDYGFRRTSYLRGVVCKPAPFGDLRDISLERPCDGQYPDSGRVSFLWYSKTDSSILYVIYGRPLGLNLHVPIDTIRVEVFGGVPKDFEFYEGYEKKYPTPEKELEDLLDKRRIESIPLLWP